ncbi:hypothetical protein ABPG72_005007 [Tetrahymena utriculariae]
MESKVLKSMMRIASQHTLNIVNNALKPYNVQSPPIKIQSVTNLVDVDYNTPTLLQVFNQNKDKKTKQAFGLVDIKALCNKVIESFNPEDKDCAIEKLGVTDQGFLTIKLKQQVIEDEINNILKNGLNYPTEKKQKIAVDFSSPNIAKEMHVGHLRSTIIGESICRIFEFQNHEVLRINHLGDWGTQFGMLIAYMKMKYPNYLNEPTDLSDLTIFYKESKKLFDENPEFKKTAQLTVVDLQSGNPECRKAWEILCEISHREFTEIYKRLDITLEDFGESFYNDKIPAVIQDLKDAGLLVESDGAQCVFIEKFKNQPPLFIVKKDGGYGYDSTDMACIKYRLKTLNCNRLVYITDVGQQPHFDCIIATAEKIGWHVPPTTRAEHMGFGIVQGEDGKRFRTRSSETVKLKDLLDEARDRALEKIKERISGGSKEEGAEEDEEEKENKGNITKLSEEEYLDAAEKMGMAAIKYYDLRQNRISNYNFSYDKMLDTKGNTAVYLLYSYARLCSIIRKSGLQAEELQKIIQTQGFKITHPQERIIASLLIKFPDVLDQVTEDLAINRLTDYMYDLACRVAEGYRKYHINNSEDKLTRILLIEATRQILEKCFYLVGIKPLEKI